MGLLAFLLISFDGYVQHLSLDTRNSWGNLFSKKKKKRKYFLSL